MSASRSNSSELEARRDAAAELLAAGMPRSLAVSALAERYGVDRRSARRYVASAAAVIVAEAGADVALMLQESIERLRRLAWAAEAQGNLSAAVGAEKAAAATAAALVRSDAMASGRTMALVEQLGPPSDAQRQRYRRRLYRPPKAAPF